MEVQLAQTGTAPGTATSCRGSLSPLPLQQVVAPTQQPCFDRAVLWCQHRAPRGFLRQLLSAEGSLGCGQAPHPCALEQGASLPAAAKALGSCLALAEIIVEFADSARHNLNTCSQVLHPIRTAVGYEKHAVAFVCNNTALLEYCKLTIIWAILWSSTPLLSLQGALFPCAPVKMFIYCCH